MTGQDACPYRQSWVRAGAAGWTHGPSEDLREFVRVDDRRKRVWTVGEETAGEDGSPEIGDVPGRHLAPRVRLVMPENRDGGRRRRTGGGQESRRGSSGGIARRHSRGGV